MRDINLVLRTQAQLQAALDAFNVYTRVLDATVKAEEKGKVPTDATKAKLAVVEELWQTLAEAAEGAKQESLFDTPPEAFTTPAADEDGVALDDEDDDDA